VPNFQAAAAGGRPWPSVAYLLSKYPTSARKEMPGPSIGMFWCETGKVDYSRVGDPSTFAAFSMARQISSYQDNTYTPRNHPPCRHRNNHIGAYSLNAANHVASSWQMDSSSWQDYQ